MLSIFSCMHWSFEYLLWKKVYLGPLPIFILKYFLCLVLDCISLLCILDINPLLDVWLEYIFSCSMGYLSILSVIFFCFMQELFSLVCFPLPVLLVSYQKNYSVQFSCSVVSDSLRPHKLQHARPPRPSLTPRVHANPCPLSR